MNCINYNTERYLDKWLYWDYNNKVTVIYSETLVQALTMDKFNKSPWYKT